MTASHTVNVPVDATNESELVELTMSASASTAAKIRALRIIEAVSPSTSFTLSEFDARFVVPASSLEPVRERLAEAGLIDEPARPTVPRLSRGETATAVVLACIAFAVRVGGVGPSSLWLDDAWVGLSARLPWSAVREVGLTAIGFTSMVKIVGGAFGPSSFAFQAVPFLFGVATPVVAIVVLRRWIGHFPAALVGLMTALSPISVTFSTRVKQYTFDAFWTVVLLALALALLERPEDRRRWIRFIAVAVVVSFGSSILLVIVAACCVSVGAVVLTKRRGALPETLRWGLVLTIVTGLYWLFVLGDNVNPSVRRYWAARYVTTDDGLSGFVTSVIDLLELAFAVAVPLPSPTWAWLLFGAAFVTMAIRRWTVALLCMTPLVITIILSAAEMAPLGGGRTDTHLMTALFIMVGFAVNEWAAIGARWISLEPHRFVPVIAAAIAIPVAMSSSSDPYPEEDIRPLVSELEAQRRDDDHLLLYYASVWPYGIYADTDVTLTESDPDLRLSLYNVAFADDLTILGNRRGEPEAYRPFVAQAVSERQRVWFISSHFRQDDLDAVAVAFLDQGYVLEQRSTATGAELTLWVPGGN